MMTSTCASAPVVGNRGAVASSPNVVGATVGGHNNPAPTDPATLKSLRASWWFWHREGVPLPAERGVIVISGGSDG